MKRIVYVIFVIILMLFLSACDISSLLNLEITVIWKNWDGTILEVDEHVPYNEEPIYNGETPIKESDNIYNYYFKEWENSVSGKEKIMIATFSQEYIMYTVYWHIGEDIIEQKYKYGDMPEYDSELIYMNKEYSYKIVEWTPQREKVTKNAEYIAKLEKVLNKYTVTWMIGEEKYEEIYDYGTTPTFKNGTPQKESTEKYCYNFIGWNQIIEKVTDNITYVAQFEEKIRDFKVTWLNYDGTILKIDENVQYGTIPSYDGPEPIKMANETISYPFIGWNEEIQAVTSDTTYTAKFNENINFISSFNDLIAIPNNSDALYVLTNNIDCNNNVLQSLEVFNGCIDGNGYEISSVILTNYSWIKTLNGVVKNLKINYIATVDAKINKYFGLIEENNGRIENITMKAALTYTSNSATGFTYGSLVSKNNGIINNITIENVTLKFNKVFNSNRDYLYSYINYYLNLGVVCGINDKNGQLLNVTVKNSEIKIESDIKNQNTANKISGEQETMYIHMNVGIVAAHNLGIVREANVKYDIDNSIYLVTHTINEEIISKLMYTCGTIGLNENTVEKVKVEGSIYNDLFGVSDISSKSMNLYNVNAVSESIHNVSIGTIVGKNEANGKISLCLAKSKLRLITDIEDTYSYVKVVKKSQRTSKSFFKAGLCVGTNVGLIKESGSYGTLDVSGHISSCDLFGINDGPSSIMINTFAYGKIYSDSIEAQFGNNSEMSTIVNQAILVLEEDTINKNKNNGTIEVTSLEQLLSKQFILNKLEFGEENWQFDDNMLIIE